MQEDPLRLLNGGIIGRLWQRRQRLQNHEIAF
jgi:hypothetical protein